MDTAHTQEFWELASDLFAVVDETGVFLAANPAWERILGYPEREIIGTSGFDLIHPDDLDRAIEALAEAVTRRVDGVELRIRAKDGSFRDVVQNAWRAEDGTVYAVGKDVSEYRRTTNFLQAITDNLADGLFVLDHRGRATLLNPAAEKLLGWDAETLLGQPMHSAIHSHRRDGSSYPGEACPIVSNADSDGVLRVEDDVFWRRDGSALPVSYSVAPFTTDEGGRGRVVLFSDISAIKAREERLQRDMDALDWVERVREALREESFVLYAQPIADAITREPSRHELLLRMLDDFGALVPPGRFLPHAERYGVIRDIDRWVVRQAAGIAAEGHRLQVNLSADSLGDPTLLAYVREELERTGANPGYLIFELTETALLRNEAAARELVPALKALGCGVALDDFGTGYGGFTYLKTLPVDYLKIDVEFVQDLPRNPASAHVVGAIVNLARGFGQRTIAEGVEDAETLRLLAEMGVDEVQGFALGNPVQVDEEWLAAVEVM